MTQLAFPMGRPVIDTEGLSPEQRDVFEALAWGRANARRIDQLAAMTGLSGRKVQAIAQTLRELYAVPIGTSMSAPFGCYLVDDPNELAACYRLFRARGLSNLKQAAALRHMSLRAYLKEVQTEIEAA